MRRKGNAACVSFFYGIAGQTCVIFSVLYGKTIGLSKKVQNKKNTAYPLRCVFLIYKIRYRVCKLVLPVREILL